MDIYAFWDAVLAQDEAEIRTYFHDDACIKWHCTNEQFCLDEFIDANCTYPGEWSGVVERVEMQDDLIITVTKVYPRDQSASFHVTSFLKIRDGRIISMNEYWADDGPAPQWRLDKRIGRAII